jgi:hypothetical protein
MMPREKSDTQANLYFALFESTHRILHIPTFWADYRRYWDYPGSVTTSLRLTILLVLAIGSSLFDYPNPEAAIRNAELVHHWIYAAETWLAGPLEKDRVDLAGLQVYCLTLVARQIFSIGGDTAWMSTGSLIHRAMQIGLHRDPQNLAGKPMSVLQAEVRRRLWGTVLELVVQASLDARMPPRISFDEFDTQLPSNVDDVEIVYGMSIKWKTNVDDVPLASTRRHSKIGLGGGRSQNNQGSRQTFATAFQRYSAEVDGTRRCHGCEMQATSLKKCAKCGFFWYCNGVRVLFTSSSFGSDR